MGVQGLWRLIEPSGKTVPLETLENKILAVDISIWLHQAIKGFQDSKGAPLPNAHLLGIYHRVCKLLYFRVKPVFVFDGGVPLLKKQTIANRREQKNKNLKDANDIQSKLLKTLLKHTAISKVISDKTSPKKDSTETNNTKDSIYMLPELPATELESTIDSCSSSDESSNKSPIKQWDFHTIDERSEHFRSLPADVRHEILTDIIETRKQSSWGRLHEIPTESNDFSSFQMKRLLKRFSVQSTLEDTIKEMGGHSLSLGELEKLLNADGIVTNSQSSTGRRIASDENTRYLLIKDVQKEIEKAKDDEENNKLIKKKLEDIEDEPTEFDSATNNEYETDLATAIQLSLEEHPSSPIEIVTKGTEIKNLELAQIEINSTDNNEYERDLAAAIQLSLQDQPSTSKKEVNSQDFSLIEHSYNEEEDDDDSDFNITADITKITRLQQAKSYMMEYSGLTPNEIDKIINSNKQVPKLHKKHSEIKQNNDILPKIDSTETKIIKDNLNTHMRSGTVNKETNMSDSDDSFIEVPDSSNIKSIELISDSEDSSFVEVNSSESNKLNSTSLQIVINPKKGITNDIFSDIFAEKKNEINLDNQKPENDIKKLELEIVINPNEEIENDIFSDIFIENQQVLHCKVTQQTEKNEETVVLKDKNFKIVETNKIKSKEIQKNEKNDKQVLFEKAILTIEELNQMKSGLATEQQELILQRNTKQRIAENITDQMYQEAQELLELFGVPYIIAPMEAEAQCAFLNEIDLTHGTITDDSDIWLFGGKTVYKNFFNHNKHVLEFRAESIEHHFKLTREQLILLALLVGSDYTVGIQGIGPVTALEILAAFPPSRDTNISILTQAELTSGLKEFKKWLNNSKAVGVGRPTLRNKLKNVNIKEGFPSLQVVQAYLQPEVETCADKFTWAKPDIVGLIDFAKEKFGWTKLKSEEILKPVIKKMEDKNSQKTIRDYFATQYKNNAELTDEKISKRVKTAIKRLGNKHETSDDDNTKRIKTKKPRKSKKVDESIMNVESVTSQIKTKRNIEIETLTTEEENETVIRKNKNKDSDIQMIINNRACPHSSSIEAKRRVKAARKDQLHAKQIIPQKEKDKKDALKSKLRAIETFRKSKAGPGFVKKRPKILTPLKDDAELSESSSD